MADLVAAGDGQHLPVQPCELRAHGLAGGEQRLDYGLQDRVAVDQCPDPPREPGLADRPDLQPEAAQHAPDAAVDVDQLAEQELAGDQQRPDLLGRRRLAVDRPEPAHAEELGDAARVAPVRLDHHRRQRRPHVAGFQQHDLEAGLGEPAVQPGRQRSRLETDPLDLHPEIPDDLGERRGLAGRLHLFHHLPGGVHQAHARQLERHVNADEVPHSRDLRDPGAGQSGPTTGRQRRAHPAFAPRRWNGPIRHLFAGSDGGARHWAIAMTLIQTAKLNGVEPMAWLTDVLERIVSGRTKATELGSLLPWNWRSNADAPVTVAA